MNRKNAYIVGIALLCSISAIADGDTKTKSKINERQTSAVSTVTSEELEKNSTPNPYNTLYGLLPGLSVLQQTGWTDNAKRIVRGR